MPESPRHDSGELPVTQAATVWCDARYVRLGDGDPLSGVVRVRHIMAIVGGLVAAAGGAGGLAYAQASGEAKSATAAVAKAEVSLRDALREKKADDDRRWDKGDKERAKLEGQIEEQRAEVNQIHRKVDLLILLSEGRLPRGMPPASDFTPAASGGRDGGR